MNGIKVDGNDILAVKYATEQARNFILENNRPFFIESMTYRISDHSTSDNSLLYRNKEELDQWWLKDPKIWIQKLLKNHSAFDQSFQQEISDLKESIWEWVISTLK